jgi:hypothetical protein
MGGLGGVKPGRRYEGGSPWWWIRAMGADGRGGAGIKVSGSSYAYDYESVKQWWRILDLLGLLAFRDQRL